MPDDQRPHFRIRYDQLGGHTHVHVWSAEHGGPEATHGHNGQLVFTNGEFARWRDIIIDGCNALGATDAVEWITAQNGPYRPLPMPARMQTEPGDPS